MKSGTFVSDTSGTFGVIYSVGDSRAFFNSVTFNFKGGSLRLLGSSNTPKEDWYKERLSNCCDITLINKTTGKSFNIIKKGQIGPHNKSCQGTFPAGIYEVDYEWIGDINLIIKKHE